jgi:hypothetical protein
LVLLLYISKLYLNKKNDTDFFYKTTRYQYNKFDLIVRPKYYHLLKLNISKEFIKYLKCDDHYKSTELKDKNIKILVNFSLQYVKNLWIIKIDYNNCDSIIDTIIIDNLSDEFEYVIPIFK